MNEFVTVDVDPVASTLTCLFQNNQSTNTKVCSVECNEQMTFHFKGNGTLDFPNRVTIQIDLPSGSDCKTYTVSASDSTNIVLVDGRISCASKQIT